MAIIPEEILQQIVSNLHMRTGRNDEHRKTLTSLSRVSKTLHRIARCELYHSVDFTVYGLNDGIDLRLLLRTFLERPGTSDLVVKLWMPHWYSQVDIDMNRVLLTPARSDMVSHYHEIVDRLGVSADLRQRLEGELKNGSRDAEISLLFCMCRKLQKLAAIAGYLPINDLFLAVMSESLVSPVQPGAFLKTDNDEFTPFRFLQEVDIEHADTEGCTELGKWDWIFHLPALQVIQGSSLECHKEFNLSSCKSDVKTISLQSSITQPSGLMNLLRACPKLENFSMTVGDATVGNSCTDFTFFGRALRHYNPKLVNLTIDFYTSGVLDFPEHLGGSLGNMASLNMLKFMRVSYNALYGYGEIDDMFREDFDYLDVFADYDGASGKDVNSPNFLAESLPVSLVTLCITAGHKRVYYPDAFDLQVLRLIQTESLPALQTIMVERQKPFTLDLAGTGWSASHVKKKRDYRQWLEFKKA